MAVERSDPMMYLRLLEAAFASKPIDSESASIGRSKANLAKRLCTLARVPKGKLTPDQRLSRSEKRLNQLQANVEKLVADLNANVMVDAKQLRAGLHEASAQASDARAALAKCPGARYESKMVRIMHVEESIRKGIKYLDSVGESDLREKSFSMSTSELKPVIARFGRDAQFTQAREREMTRALEPLVKRWGNRAAPAPQEKALRSILSRKVDGDAGLAKPARRVQVPATGGEAKSEPVRCPTAASLRDSRMYKQLAEEQAAGTLPDDPFSDPTLCGDGVVEATAFNGKSQFASTADGVAISNVALGN